MKKFYRQSWMKALAASLALAGSLWAATDSANGDDSIPPRGGQGTVKIITTPEKAVAYLDGIKLGLTPIDTSFESGRKTLTIMLNGEELVRERVNVWPNQTLTVDKKLLMPYGSIVIHVNPIKVNYKVMVDGEEVGSTKGGVLTINRLEAGTRVIRLSNGKHSKEYNVNVLPEQSVDLNADFKR